VPRFAWIGALLGIALLVSLAHEPFTNAPNFGRAVTEGVVLGAVGAMFGRGRAASATVALLALGGVVLAGWTIWATTPLT
jgi:hypothetical protein